MSQTGKVRALSASLRLPNLPSVWSNTLTGVILACLIYETRALTYLPLALLAATCLYFAGNLLNDWADRNWDKQHRPERALPGGIFLPKSYLLSAVMLILIGLAASAIANPAALLISGPLSACIIIYTWCHKKTAWSVIPMALCRALLPLLGFFACSEDWSRIEYIAIPACLLFIYLILLSLRARSESTNQAQRSNSLLSAASFLLPPLIVATFWFVPHAWHDATIVALLSAIPYLIWVSLALTLYRSPVPRQVSALLAGIPLIDSLFLMPYLLMGFIYTPNNTAIFLCMAWLPAFILGRLLQRYVPAT